MKTGIIIGIFLAICGSLSAQTTKPKNAPAHPAKELADKIGSSDAAVRAAAVEEFRQQMSNPVRMVGPLSQQYLPALLKAGLNQEVVDWAMQAMLTAPTEAGTLERLHASRIRALLALNRPEEALAESKSFFNVCTMKGTGGALLLCMECIQAVHPEDKGLVERFKRQQVAGAATQPSTQPAEPNMLKAVKVNAEPYLERANSPQLQNETYVSLTRRGNLLLEADHLAEARQCFEAAYPLATEKDQAKAAESVARVMKAEDGTVGRANAYVLSLRPAAPATQLAAQSTTQPATEP